MPRAPHMRLPALGLVLVVAATLLAATGAAAAPVVRCNVAIPMSDGVKLRANITSPGEGAYPTILTVTGYNKDLGNPTGQCAAGDAALVAAGYNVVVVDDRGTGSSDGRWDIWGQRTQQDYPELLDWIVAQPWSDGTIGTTGGSYLGITSLLVAATGHPAVKAVFADVPMSDAYRDVTYYGGALDTTFMPFWFGFTQATNTNPPTQLAQGEALPDVALNAADHVGGGPATVGAQLVTSGLTGRADGDAPAYDTPAQRYRSPADRAHGIEAAVFYTGGWFDIFQRGSAYLWNSLTNVPEDGRKWVQSPIYHTGGDSHWDELGIGSKSEVKIAWFDRWLKGERNGIEDIPDIHLWDVGAERWETSDRWPLRDTQWTSYYLSAEASGSGARSLADGTLTPHLPAAPAQARLPFSPVGPGCNRATIQWAAGVGSGAPVCEEDQRIAEATQLTWTTPPLAADLDLTGPITLRLWAELDRNDAFFNATLSDVAPDGASRPISAGALMASHRALDHRRTWRNRDGDVILPWHPFTLEAQRDIPIGDLKDYQIEIFPTDWTLQEGHRLRLTLGTGDTPHYAIPANRLDKMLGGQIRVVQGGPFGSELLLPVQAPRR